MQNATYETIPTNLDLPESGKSGSAGVMPDLGATELRRLPDGRMIRVRQGLSSRIFFNSVNHNGIVNITLGTATLDRWLGEHADFSVAVLVYDLTGKDGVERLSLSTPRATATNVNLGELVEPAKIPETFGRVRTLDNLNQKNFKLVQTPDGLRLDITTSGVCVAEGEHTFGVVKIERDVLAKACTVRAKADKQAPRTIRISTFLNGVAPQAVEETPAGEVESDAFVA